jgi:hypothetical protein
VPARGRTVVRPEANVKRRLAVTIHRPPRNIGRCNQQLLLVILLRLRARSYFTIVAPGIVEGYGSWLAAFVI